MQRIADADTLMKKRAVERQVMRGRLRGEKDLKEPTGIDDEYGVDRINAMIADIKAEYNSMGVNIGVTHNAGVVGTESDEDEEEDSDSYIESRPTKRCINFSRYIQYSSVYTSMQDNTLCIHSCHTLRYPYRRRVSTSTASQQQVHHLHWSRRVTADNPHGFADKVLVRLRAIEDPAQREKEEKKVLDQRRRNEKQRPNTETAARHRDQMNERYRQQKINAGYVMLIIVQLKIIARIVSSQARFVSIYSCRVLTRYSNHWSQRVSDDNPRGYNEIQMQRIADAGTLVKKRSVELKVMRERLKSEMKMKEPIDDEYGVDRINAMIADINAEYAAMGVNIGVTHNTSVVGTEGDEDEEEESGSDHEPRPTKRYVYISINAV
jgi:hypothetical protein